MHDFLANIPKITLKKLENHRDLVMKMVQNLNKGTNKVDVLLQHKEIHSWDEEDKLKEVRSVNLKESDTLLRELMMGDVDRILSKLTRES